MKNVFYIIMISLLACMLNGTSCKKVKLKPDTIPGQYRLKRHGYSHWCETYKTKAGKDSIAYFGDYSFLYQPDDMKEAVAVITKNNSGDYFICLEGNCTDSLFNPRVQIASDSVTFGTNFKVFDKIFTVQKMKGVKTTTGYAGVYVEYAYQAVSSSTNPHSHIFIGTFELIKK